MKIKGRTIGEGNPAYIIAECGLNHNGDYDTARRMIDVAKDCGVDCVKFQKRYLPSIYSKEVLNNPHLASISLGVYIPELKRCELNIDTHFKLKQHCADAGVDYLCTPFDISSAEELEQIGVEFYKIASVDLINNGLIEEIVGYKKPILISTGMSKIEEIEGLASYLKEYCAEYMFMHCVSTYPTDFKDVNLAMINKLKEIHEPVGYSGHERGIEISVCAVAMGASVIERHFTLDRTMKGLDHASSLEPEGLKRMVKHIRDFELAKGDGIKKITRGEQIVSEALGRTNL